MISATRAGDARAYGLLYERHAEAARRLAGQIVRRPADVDDVVAETFAKVLSAMRRGSGPTEAFRPYLLTSVRRVALDQARGQRDQYPVDNADLPDPGEPFTDPAVASLERSLVARAFQSLPERWSAVLWHTEVEQARPAEVALLLGITPNGVAALSYRAREGLRQAYLQMHLSSRTPAECQPVAGKLGAHVRGALSSREAYRVDSHLRGCRDCLAAHTELTAINGALRSVLGPAVLGGQAAAYLAAGGHAAAAAAAGGGLAMWPGRALRWLLAHRPARTLRWLLVHRPGLPITAGVAVTAIMLPVAILVYPHSTTPRPHGTQPSDAAVPPGSTPVARIIGSTPGSSSPQRTGWPSPRSTQSPSPLPSPSGSPSPSPTGSQSWSPSGSPSPSPTGSPSPQPTGSDDQLDVTVDVQGPFDLGLVAVVSVEIVNPGRAATTNLTADLTLPPGTVALGLNSGWSGWHCSSSGIRPVSCTHAAIAPGDSATLSFRLLVVGPAGCGKTVLATVTAGSLSATGASADQIQCDAL